ncbi:MAG: hypothetical protein SGARI_003571, partial [Bacillariaceae sp.]
MPTAAASMRPKEDKNESSNRKKHSASVVKRASNVRSNNSPKYKVNQKWLFAVLVFVLLVYLVGLHQGLKVARAIETDTSDRMWKSFMGLFDSDDGDDDESEADDDGIADKSARDDIRDENNDLESTNDVGKLIQAATTNALSTFDERVNHYKDRLQKYREKKKGNDGPKAVEVMHEAPETLRLPKPIINVGFPKAGTSTIFSFFHCNGLSGQHWFCCDDTKQKHPAWSTKRKLMSKCMIDNLINGTKVLEGCGDFDVYTEINGPRYFRHTDGANLLDDGTVLPKNRSLGSNFRLFFPQHHQIERIHQDYPNATFILNLRPVDSWVASVMKWSQNLKYEILNEFFYRDQTRFLFGNNFTETDFVSPFFNASKHVPGLLKMVYEYHTEFIRAWMAKHPEHALVEVDITQNETGRILADAFGLQEDCWGHFNKKVDKEKDFKKDGL